jgi:hypothetical protein
MLYENQLNKTTYSMQESADLLGVTTRTLSNWHKNGDLSLLKVSSKKVVTRDELLRLLQSRGLLADKGQITFIAGDALDEGNNSCNSSDGSTIVTNDIVEVAKSLYDGTFKNLILTSNASDSMKRFYEYIVQKEGKE